MSAEYVDPWFGDLNADGSYANPNLNQATSDVFVNAFMNQIRPKKNTIVAGRSLNDMISITPSSAGYLPKQDQIIGAFDGYYTQPAVSADRVIFVSEDELYSVPIEGGVAKAITSGVGMVRYAF